MPMELMKRLLKRKGLHQAVMFTTFAGRGARGSIFMGVAQLRLVRCVCVQSRPGQLARRAFVSPAVTLLPHPRRHPRRAKSLPGKNDLARAYIKAGELWMDIGPWRGRQIARACARSMVGRHDPPVAIHGGRHGISRDS